MTILQKKRLLAVTTFAACAAIPGLAQEAPVAGATPQAGTGEDIIVLTPFEVTANSDTGYVATETLAGTRIRTNLGDVGSAITVLTKDFLSDIGATDSSTLLQYTPNAEVAGTRSTYTGLGNMQGVDETASLRSPSGAQRMRGLAAANNTRDFFATDIPWDSFNVDRVDIQRGANSMLFGLGSPAGIINATVQGADFRNAGTAEYRVASYGSQRGVLNLNQQLVDKVLAIRVAGLWDHENFSQKHAFENDERVFVAAKFDPKLFKDPGFHTSFRAKYEHGEIDANRPRIVPPNDSITPWYRPMSADQRSWTLDNGMGKTVVNNGYDANRSDVGSFIAGNGLALQTRRTQYDNPNYQPWLAAPFNQQQPFWLFNGEDGQNYRVVGGYINTGAINSSGGAASQIGNRNYADQFFGITNLATYATNAEIPLSGSGQYRNASLTDDSIFDFYNDLIDGPNKREWENWTAYNIEFSQTAFNDRLGLQLAYDHQDYESGGEGLLGTLINGAPTISIDILKNFQDYYLQGVSGAQVDASNPNFGRPYVISTAGGTGTSYESSREYMRGSLFGELRASDFLRDEFWVKLLGKHRFNAVFSKETYSTENRSWQNLAMPQSWDAYWNNNDGSGSSLRDRPPAAAIYLGGSVAGLDSASSAHIPGIQSKVTMADSPIYIFNSRWNADASVSPSAPWNVPSGLSRIYNGQPYGFGTAPQLTQASNPDNYIGWSTYSTNMMRYDDGADERLLSRAQLLKKVTTSSAFSWQGYFWNEAIVPTIGWRHDKVKQKSYAAVANRSNRSILDMSPDVYALPGKYDPAQTYAADSKTYSGVVHLNKLMGKKDVLPLNVSLTYSKSDNFDVTDMRVDLYGNPIGNPTGKTKDYGVLLATKDGKYSLRAIKYETKMTNATSTLSNTDSIGQVVQQGLKFRNVFLYRLNNYYWEAENPQQRNTWGGTAGNPALAGGSNNAADTSITYEEGLRRTDEAIRTWNEIHAWLAPTGFFTAWGFSPQDVSCLTDRSTYMANPSAFVPPDTSKVYNYGRTRPQGFAVTEDSTSKGYEFEFTANPLPNWRVSINASKATAIRRNVGGEELSKFVDYIDGKLYNADGTQTWAGLMPQFGNTGLSINNNIWNAFRGSYMLLKLQEGAAASELRKWHFNVVTNYTFQSGFLKNVGVGGSYRWQDKVVIGYPVVPEGARYSFDLSKPYYGDPESGIDLWVSYERKLTSKINWKIQVNVRNLGEKDGLIPVTVQPDGKTWATVRVKPTEEWSLTNTFSF